MPLEDSQQIRCKLSCCGIDFMHSLGDIRNIPPPFEIQCPLCETRVRYDHSQLVALLDSEPNDKSFELDFRVV